MFLFNKRQIVCETVDLPVFYGLVLRHFAAKSCLELVRSGFVPVLSELIRPGAFYDINFM